jgi:glycosyltransferase involved in cell wall biosynthesis
MTNPDEIKVLLFTDKRIRYGAEEHMLTLLRELPRPRFRLHMVCPFDLAEMIQSDLPGDVELLAMPLLPATLVRDILGLANILKQRRIDILHSHMSSGSRFASPIGWACRVPVVLETPHVKENWRSGWLKSSYLPDRFFGSFVDQFIAVSEANGRYLLETKRLPRKKVVVIRNGSDLKRFGMPQEKRSIMRKRFGFSEDTPILIVPARLEPQKGHWVLLEAIPTVCSEFPNLQVFCLGDGSLHKELEEKAAHLHLENTVRFLGFVADIGNWFALGDLTVLPSFYEGLPLAAIESLAMSRPVVATAVDGTPEVVVDGVTGRTVPPGQPHLLAEAICSLLRQPALMEQLGRQGRSLVEQEFSQEEQVRRTGELYIQAWRQRCPAQSGLSQERN